MISHFGPLGPKALRIRRNVVVVDAIVDSNWSLPHPRSAQEVELHAHLTTTSLLLRTNIDDNYEWVAGDSPACAFKASTT